MGRLGEIQFIQFMFYFFLVAHEIVSVSSDYPDEGEARVVLCCRRVFVCCVFDLSKIENLQSTVNNGVYYINTRLDEAQTLNEKYW